MVTILPPATNLGVDIGKGAREGFNETFLPALQQQYQRSRLQDAFNKIQPGGNFLDQIKSIAPDLLTTPGGAQALSELVVPLSGLAQSRAIEDSINQRRANRGQSPGSSSNNQSNINQNVEQQPNTTAANTGSQRTDFRNPKPPSSPNTPFPKRTAGPTPHPEMSPDQIEDFALDIMKQAAQTGKPKPYEEAYNIALQRNNLIKESNNQIQKEKEAQEAAQSRVSQGMVTRGKNLGLIKHPEDETVLRKFANEALNASDPEMGWEYVRTQMGKYQGAKEGLLRNYDLPGPITEAYRKLISGSYKDQETAADQAQKSLNFYREHGLYEPARNDLMSGVGLGPEQAERWLFPPSKEEKKDLDSFRKNERGPEVKYEQGNIFSFSDTFPGDAYQLTPERFQEFKEDIYDFLKKNPETNLISFRGNLNQDKKYSWQDISRAINELMEEKRFRPDAVQESQMRIIDNAPLPGLAEQFQFLWSGKK